MDQLGSDMLVDSDYDEKQQDAVAVISTPDDSMDEPEQVPKADDFEAIRDRFMITPVDLEVEAEGMHTWEIEAWRSMPKRSHGPTFQVGGHPWRILFFPAGNNASESVSFYLEQGHDTDSPPEGWYACVQFMLVLWNPNDPNIYIHHEAQHRFTAEEGDWGFTRFADKNKIFASRYEQFDRPLVEGDTAKITAYVRVMKDPTGVLWHNFNNYDSKKETGMIGLRNQGATCYLNSLLQSLYFTNAFRKAIYQIPTDQESEAKGSAWSLQRLFYRLQTDEQAVSTAELTQSFGWESRQIFEQQDVQELSRILMEKMEEKMKGTEAENALAQMFVGKMKTYIKCINVDYESSRIEDFWDLQLNVSGCKTVDDSFRNYVEVETLEGDNKYHAEGYGLQDAKKGVIFDSFPQVLHLQLKRFEYDFQRDMMVKVNDRYEFPEEFDAAPYLSDTADKSEPYVYHLHGVLVHSGDMNAGHYYAFIKPTKNGDFYKFDDDRVTKATKREAMEENFGGDYGPNGTGGGLRMQNPFSRTWSTKRSMSAYMLVYIRESRLDQILPPQSEIAPPDHLPTRLNEEKAMLEKRRKEREEAHLYMGVQVATNDNFSAYQGFDLVPWETQDDEEPFAPRTMRVLKAMTIADFIKLYANETGVDAETLRPWVVVNRQNGTKRPDQPVMPMSMTLDEAALKHGNRQAYFRIWMEKTTNAHGSINGLDETQVNGTAEKKPIIIFLKYFDVATQELKGVGHVYMSPSDRVQELATPILKMMDWPAGSVDLRLFEEIKPNFVETMKPKQTLHQSELQDGDIVCFQKALSEGDIQSIQAKSPSAYLDAPAFYDYLQNRVVVHFAPKPAAAQSINIDTEDETRFSLFLSKKDTYDNLALKVAEHLSNVSKTPVDPTHVRFTTINASSQKPRAIVKRLPTSTLTSILLGSASGGYTGYGYASQSTDSLYYEVLEMSLADLEQRKLVKVLLLSDGISREEQYDILVPKIGTLADVASTLAQKASISSDQIPQIRFVEAHSGKVHRVLGQSFAVANLNEFCIVYAEFTPAEEAAIHSDTYEGTDRVIHCFHFEKEPAKTHAVPFEFVVKDGEIFKETKERVSKRTGIKGKALEKVKFAVIKGGQAYVRPAYVDDEDILSERLADGDQLGLEHPNKARANWAQHERLNIR